MHASLIGPRTKAQPANTQIEIRDDSVTRLEIDAYCVTVIRGKNVQITFCNFLPLRCDIRPDKYSE